MPALHSVLFYFTLEVTFGYSISLIRDPARGTSQLHVLMKPSMFGREIRERLLNDGVCDGGNLLAL